MRFNRRHILLALLVITILSVFLPIPVRYSFMASAKVYPLSEWKLTRGVDEGFFSQTYNYETDALSDYKNYRFERGDIAELVIKPGLHFDSLISRNDTVAFIESYFLQNEIVRLNNLRDVEIANLNVVSTGEKQSLVDQAQREYVYAQQQLDLEKKNFARQDKLYRDSVITPAEFDLYENTLKLAEINAEVTYNALKALSTGEKDPVLTLSEQKILSYEKEIERLETQKAQYIIASPVAGLLSYDASLGGILKVSDNRRLVLKIPVPYQHSTYLKSLFKVTFATPDNKITTNATFKGFDENISLIQNQQFVIAKAITSEYTPEIYPGMVVQCRIYCDRVSILEYLKRNFSVSF
jgi:hypothetical protein